MKLFSPKLFEMRTTTDQETRMKIYVKKYPKFIQLIILWAASGLFSSVCGTQAIALEDAVDPANFSEVSASDAKTRKGKRFLDGLFRKRAYRIQTAREQKSKISVLD